MLVNFDTFTFHVKWLSPSPPPNPSPIKESHAMAGNKKEAAHGIRLVPTGKLFLFRIKFKITLIADEIFAQVFRYGRFYFLVFLASLARSSVCCRHGQRSACFGW